MSTASQPQQPVGAPRTGAAAVLAIVAGAVVALVAFGLLVGGGGLVGAHLFARDADGYYSSHPEAARSAGYAVTSEALQIGDLRAGTGDWVADAVHGQVRIRATGTAGRP